MHVLHNQYADGLHTLVGALRALGASWVVAALQLPGERPWSWVQRLHAGRLRLLEKESADR